VAISEYKILFAMSIIDEGIAGVVAVSKWLVKRVRSQHNKLMEENVRLKDRVRELENLTDARKGLVLHRNIYWPQDSSFQKEPAFCPACLDATGKRITLTLSTKNNVATCPVCNAKYWEVFRDSPGSIPRGTRRGRWK